MDITREFRFIWNGSPGVVGVVVRVYDAGNPEMLNRSHRTWRFRSVGSAQLVGGRTLMFESVGGTFDMNELYTRAIPGEIDIICVGLSELPAPWMPETLESAAHATAMTLSFALDDLLVPVGMSRKIDPGRAYSDSPPIQCRVARSVGDPLEAVANAIDQAMTRHIDTAWWSNRRGSVFPRAAQRFTKASLAIDPVDTYLEYWLACEFVVSRVGRGPVSRQIAEVLAPHVGWTTRKRRHELYEALRLKDLERVRNHIVHGDTDTVTNDDLSLISAIASELIKSEIGLDYSGNETIDNATTAYSHHGRKPSSSES